MKIQALLEADCYKLKDIYNFQQSIAQKITFELKPNDIILEYIEKLNFVGFTHYYKIAIAITKNFKDLAQISKFLKIEELLLTKILNNLKDQMEYLALTEDILECSDMINGDAILTEYFHQLYCLENQRIGFIQMEKFNQKFLLNYFNTNFNQLNVFI